jgi:prevent-host-death family protein
MKTIGASDAKTQFPVLLDKVREGEQFTIVRDGVPIALLIPAARRVDSRLVIERLRDLRRGVKLNGDNIRDLIEQGRRL